MKRIIKGIEPACLLKYRQIERTDCDGYRPNYDGYRPKKPLTLKKSIAD
ncbi:hypothetical protein [Aphanizomenon flos-aquae]|nr:hypothetical protein [Aphanizomenon flos-aquae]